MDVLPDAGEHLVRVVFVPDALRVGGCFYGQTGDFFGDIVHGEEVDDVADDVDGGGLLVGGCEGFGGDEFLSFLCKVCGEGGGVG